MTVSAPAPVHTGTFAVRDVRAVLPDRVLDGASVVCEGGLITSVRPGGAVPPGALDGRGALLVPGIVDVHSDALERDITPRPGTSFPIGFALAAFESRVRAAGVTTVFHGVGFQDNPGYHRSLEQARAVCAALRERRASGATPVEHRVLHRMDVRSPDALDVLLDCLPAPGPEVPLVSCEDHTPGQGQYRDLDRFVAARMRELPGRSAEEAADLVRERIAARDALREHVGRNRSRLAALAAAGRIRLLAHDVDSPEEVRRVHAGGAAVAEFPVTLDAARAAKDAGMPVVMGAPNVIRGGSHSGNVGARELVAAGLVDALASDYSPPALLAAALGLAAERVVALPAAVALVTAGAAAVGGLRDRGRLVEGARADLLLVDDTDRWPRVRTVLPAE
ncbi:alpha-D-ribose 1-methylphosphonate 5-triphosphate diphosphatase [Pseudonocardia sichuanensis]|uniref:Alpha-D-ribose 1-methylphosphonate 5-triphosphate diphosphatase n=1 Tax=Pseudonocardia kunmingensis TaxID=630975 RepID=A0A543D3Y3_9PSEU|nr:alpha-D-ribose 1-methylphosphonate 5-triphosphate diphosphatase [Pseudonocardia kunmingensis]TQM04040.1 alpha-D-ribose 1-methylphosphonate 5-triphosphate diphosphatase [Pseudonocardia kunmingensis]